MDLDTSGRTYLIVGGTRGMGWESAVRLAENGANIVLVGRDSASAAKHSATLQSQHGVRALGLAADASQSRQIDSAVQTAIHELGPIRGLLITTGSTAHNGSLLDMTDTDWENSFQDVLMGHVRSCRAVIPHMLEHGGGQIVTTAAYSARAAKSFLFGYAAMKAAVVNFTKNLAKTYGAQGIRANCVCPGAIETEQLQQRRKEAAEKYGLPLEEALEHVMFEEWKLPVAMQSVGKPQHVADLMTFLLSERAAYLTGAVINIDGGTDF